MLRSALELPSHTRLAKVGTGVVTMFRAHDSTERLHALSCLLPQRLSRGHGLVIPIIFARSTHHGYSGGLAKTSHTASIWTHLVNLSGKILRCGQWLPQRQKSRARENESSAEQ
jgi:hypothetical protein